MKKFRIWTSLVCSTLVLGGTLTPALILTSCSSSKNDYKYNIDSKNFQTSQSMFGWSNIFDAVQQLGAKNQFNKVPQILNKLIDVAPNLFDQSTKLDIVSMEWNNNILRIPILNNVNVVNIQIKFKDISLSSIDVPSSNVFGIQANSTFFNMTINDISNLSGNEILSLINQNSYSNLPSDSYIYTDYKILSNDSIKYYIFLPNLKIPVGIINIYFTTLNAPTVIPLEQISKLNINNDWQDIVNWQTPSIDTNQYSYIENILPNDLHPDRNIISTYNTAAKSNIVLRKFESNLYSGEGVKKNIINDYYYCVKNVISNIVNSWLGSNLLDLNVYCGNNIIVENDKISGNFALQFENTTSISQLISKNNFYLNIDIPEIEIPKNGVFVMIINFQQSKISPALSMQSTINNTGFLTNAFNNVSLELFSNNICLYKYESNDNSYMFMPNSLTQSTIVKNVYPGTSIIENTNLFEKSINNLAKSDLNNINKHYIESEITKFKIMLNAIQNIIVYSGTNPTIYEFLTNINNDLYNVILALTNNEYIASIVGNLFTNQKVSTFLYYNLDNIINVINDLIPESEAKMGLLGMLYDIKKSNSNLDQMKIWVSNLVSLKPMLEKVLNGQLGWLLQIIGPLLENISLDPNIFDCLLSMLPDIFVTLLSQSGTIGNLGNALIKYFANLIDFANNYDPDCVKNPISTNAYKDLRVLDFIVSEFTEGNDNSLMDIILAIVGNNNSTVNTISNVLKAINFKMNCKIRTSVKNQILQTYNYEEKNLYDVIKWIINEFFLKVKLEDGTTTDLYSAISNNLIYTYQDIKFEYDTSNNWINQECNWIFNIKQKITFNTLPIAALISKENIKIDLSNLNLPSWVNSIVNLLLNNALPVNIVVSPNNSINAFFEANNSRLFPVVSKNGSINWNYLTNNTVVTDVSNILNDSNVRTSPQEKCYGSSYALLKTALSSFISTKAYTNKITWMQTQLENPVIINNYNNDSYISELYMNQLYDDASLITDFQNWITDSNNYKYENNQYLINYESLNIFISERFDFSKYFLDNNFASYMTTITSANYKVFSDTNSYTLNIVFPCPVLIIKPDNSCYLSNSYTLTVNL